MVETLRSWKGSGSGFISELFARWPLPGPGWHCQHQPTSSAHVGSSLFREIVSISQYRRFLPLIAWPLARCALRLQPHKHLHAQEIVYTRRPPACPHVRSLSHLLLPPAPAPGETPGELPRWGQILIHCEVLSPSWGWISCLGWMSLSFGLGANRSPQSPPHQINLETTVCPSSKKEVVYPSRGTPSSGCCSPSLCPLALPPSA